MEDEPPKERLPEGVEPFTDGTKRNVLAYPVEWASGFGSNYYRHAQARELAAFDRDGMWDVLREGTPVNESPLQVTSMDKIDVNIREIIGGMRQEVPND